MNSAKSNLLQILHVTMNLKKAIDIHIVNGKTLETINQGEAKTKIGELCNDLQENAMEMSRNWNYSVKNNDLKQISKRYETFCQVKNKLTWGQSIRCIIEAVERFSFHIVDLKRSQKVETLLDTLYNAFNIFEKLEIVQERAPEEIFTLEDPKKDV